MASNESSTATLRDILENIPLHESRRVVFLYYQPEYAGISFPEEIRMHCNTVACAGVRRHSKDSYGNTKYERVAAAFGTAVYICTDCGSSACEFAIRCSWEKTNHAALVTKIYQNPAFGNPIPKRLFTVIGEENRDLFLQARRAIARGLGIGAYAYYRRIVENNKLNLVTAVLDVARSIQADSAIISRLEAAQKETQFSKAIDLLREQSAIPAALLIEGHNPLLLLHDLLSEGIHAMSDEECLSRAREAEIILSDLADRMQAALTEKKSVKEALSSILSRKAKPAS